MLPTVVGNPTKFVAILAQQRVELKKSLRAPLVLYRHRPSPQQSTTHGPVSLGRGVRQFPTQIVHRVYVIPSKNAQLQSTNLFRKPFFYLSPWCRPRQTLQWGTAITNRWETIVNTPLLSMLQASTTNNNATSHTETVDLSAPKLNDLSAGGNVLRLDIPKRSLRSCKGHVRDNSRSSTVSNGTHDQ